jgi:adenylate cyclase
MQTSNAIFNPASWHRGLRAGLFAFLLLGALQVLGLLQGLEHAAQDALRKAQARPYQTPIEIVYLDDVSLRQAEEQFQMKYPWPREAYANCVDFLRTAGAKAVVFDFLFTSGSSYGPDDDKLFASAARRQGLVIAGMQFTSADQPDARGIFFKQAPLYQLSGVDPASLRQAHGVTAPLPPLWGAFAGVGDTSFTQDSDSKGRRNSLAVAMDGHAYPSLALSAALALGAKAPDLSRDREPLVLFRQPKGEAGATRLFDLAASWSMQQAGQKPLVDPARFKGKIVLIGSSSPGLNDLRPTPLGKAMPGVELQAMMLDNLLSGESLTALPLGPAYWLFLLLLCLGVAHVSFRFRGLFVVVPFLAAAAANEAAALWAYQSLHLLLPLALPSLAALLAFSCGALENYFDERQSRQNITAIFGQFLSPAVLQSLRSQGDSLEMGGETRELTVFFSDLQGFTSFSEKLSPTALVEILNEYLGDMTELLVGRFDATVDKYIGDAIMCFWNAPTDQGDHALRGCKAAWACQQRLGEVQAKLKSMGLDAGEEGLVMRIGLNTGPAIAGLMGSRRKLNYTVMGDTVNTASRLEGANKPYGTRIMLSAATKDAAGAEVLTRPLDYIKVKGKADATPVFEVIGIQGEEGRLYPDGYVAAWSQALAQYKAGDFQGALGAFQACGRAQPQDRAVALFTERCEHFLHEPPQAWDGVYTMKTK